MHGLAFFGLFGGLYPAYLRGEADLALHQGAEAAAEFQKVLDHPGIVIADPIGGSGIPATRSGVRVITRHGQSENGLRRFSRALERC